MSTTKRPAPGWYADPSRAKTKRYWDGDAWTEQRQEEPPTEPVPDWQMALAVVAALLLPILGLIAGALMWSRARTPAIVVLVISVGSALYWTGRILGWVS